MREPKQPNMSPPDTELYKALADSLRRRAPGTRGGARDPGRLHRQLGLPRAAGCTATAGARSWWTTRRLRRIHGNDERLSLDNIRAGRARLHRDAAGRGRGLSPIPWPPLAPDDPSGHPARRPDDPRADPRARPSTSASRTSAWPPRPGSGVTASARAATSRPSSAAAAAGRSASRLYFFTYSTFLARPTLYLEDLFVTPAERGRGAGRALLRALARIAVRRRCGRMEWTVLDWNRPAIRVYRHLGAALRRDWILTRLTGRRWRGWPGSALLGERPLEHGQPGARALHSFGRAAATAAARASSGTGSRSERRGRARS